MSPTFMPLVLAIIVLSTQVTTALRDGLTAQVPVLPTLSARWRPWVAAAVGAVAAFCGALGAGAATGGISEAVLVAAGVAAISNLAIVTPKLIYTESNQKAVAKGAAADLTVALRSADTPKDVGHLVMMLAAGAFGLACAAAPLACTAAQLQGLSAALAAFGSAAPAACPIVAAVDGAAVGKVCSQDAAGAAQLAAALSAIIATLPPTAAPKVSSAPPVAYDAGGFHVELRADIAPHVQAAAKAKAVAK